MRIIYLAVWIIVSIGSFIYFGDEDEIEVIMTIIGIGFFLIISYPFQTLNTRKKIKRISSILDNNDFYITDDMLNIIKTEDELLLFYQRLDDINKTIEQKRNER